MGWFRCITHLNGKDALCLKASNLSTWLLRPFCLICPPLWPIPTSAKCDSKDQDEGGGANQVSVQAFYEHASPAHSRDTNPATG